MAIRNKFAKMELYNKIKELYKQGLTQVEIGKQLGLSKFSINYHIKQMKKKGLWDINEDNIGVDTNEKEKVKVEVEEIGDELENDFRSIEDKEVIVETIDNKDNEVIQEVKEEIQTTRQEMVQGLANSIVVVEDVLLQQLTGIALDNVEKTSLNEVWAKFLDYYLPKQEDERSIIIGSLILVNGAILLRRKDKLFKVLKNENKD